MEGGGVGGEGVFLGGSRDEAGREENSRVNDVDCDAVTDAANTGAAVAACVADLVAFATVGRGTCWALIPGDRILAVAVLFRDYVSGFGERIPTYGFWRRCCGHGWG